MFAHLVLVVYDLCERLRHRYVYTLQCCSYGLVLSKNNIDVIGFQYEIIQVHPVTGDVRFKSLIQVIFVHLVIIYTLPCHQHSCKKVAAFKDFSNP